MRFLNSSYASTWRVRFAPVDGSKVAVVLSECTESGGESGAGATLKWKGEYATSVSRWSTCSVYEEAMVMGEEKVKEPEERVRGKRVEESKYASKLSSRWFVGLEKESKEDRVRAKGEPAVTAVGKVEAQRSGSVGAGLTVTWKAPLWRV